MSLPPKAQVATLLAVCRETDPSALPAAEAAARSFESLNVPSDPISLNLALHALRKEARLTGDEVDVLAVKLKGERGFQGLDFVAFARQYGVPGAVIAACQRRIEAPEADMVSRAVSSARTEGSAAGRPAPPPPPPPARTFAGSLIHQFPLVSRQAENGLYAVKRVAAYLKKLCAHDGEYSREMIKATSHETTKLDRLQGDGMKSYINAWISTLEIMHTHANAHAAFKANVMSAVVLPLQAFYKEREAQRKDIISDMAHLSKDMKAVNDGVKKAKGKAMHLLESLRAARDRDAGVPPRPAAEAGDSGKGFSKWGSKLAGKLRGTANESVESLTEKAQAACASYQRALADANARKTKFRRQDLPRVFEELNDIEVARLDVLKEHLTKFALLFHELVSPQEEMSSRLVQAVAAVDTAGDVDAFIDTWVAVHGEPPAEQALRYDLPATAEELRAGRWGGSLELRRQADTIFGATLEEVMAMQRKQGHASSTVPVAVTALTAAVLERGGPGEVGIFRISAPKTEVDALKARFERGDYTVPGRSAHVPAGLLKLWLRSMADPLVPDELYQEAVDAAKDDGFSPQRAAALWVRVPDLTRRTWIEVVRMLKLVAANSDENKMTVPNLAIVFAPSLLRCMSDNPLEMMQNSKFETRFTAMLLEAQMAEL